MGDLEELLQKFAQYAPHADAGLLQKAYLFSQKAHAHQNRASGEHYFSHCLAVGEILVDFKLDLPTLAAALLHDVLEDTEVTGETMEKEFGPEITQLVQGVTKVARLPPGSWGDLQETPEPHLIPQAENWRKMLLATAKDIRVILIKLADRLHNMRTLCYLDHDKQRRIAQETLSLYAPLAQRLGMFQLKSELEDLAFEVLEPQRHKELVSAVQVRHADRQKSLESFRCALEAGLAPSGIPYRMLARPKNYYSLWGKMKRQKKPFEEIQDTLGVRLITDTIANCYALLGLVHTLFKPMAGTFTDYLAIPKANLYQSLHTTVLSPSGDPVEIQLRTEQMHRTAEYGIAAHWRYKTPTLEEKDLHLEEKLNWLRQWIEWLQDLKSPREFLESLQTDLELYQVFVFTPKGEVKPLPAGSTPVDFAYAVHTDIGHTCYGAKVSGKMVKLDTPLKSGEICEILTRKRGKPNKDWLNFARTARARSKIRRYFREHPH